MEPTDQVPRVLGPLSQLLEGLGEQPDIRQASKGIDRRRPRVRGVLGPDVDGSVVSRLRPDEARLGLYSCALGSS